MVVTHCSYRTHRYSDSGVCQEVRCVCLARGWGEFWVNASVWWAISWLTDGVLNEWWGEWFGWVSWPPWAARLKPTGCRVYRLNNKVLSLHFVPFTPHCCSVFCIFFFSRHVSSISFFVWSSIPCGSILSPFTSHCRLAPLETFHFFDFSFAFLCVVYFSFTSHSLVLSCPPVSPCFPFSGSVSVSVSGFKLLWDTVHSAPPSLSVQILNQTFLSLKSEKKYEMLTSYSCDYTIVKYDFIKYK